MPMSGDVSSVDVAIIGGGIVGSSTALQLARRGVKVAVFERGKIASEQSSRAWGFIRQQGRHEAEVPLAAEANGLWVELTAEHGQPATGFTRGGILVPAETEADEERVVVEGHRTATAYGLGSRILDAAGIRELVPQFAGRWRSGLYTPADAHGDPALSTRTIAAAAKAAGAAFHEDTPVLAVETSAGKVSGIVTAAGRCKAPVVLLANGIGAPALAGQLGLELPIQIVKSSVGQTVAAAPFTEVAMWTPRVAFRPRGDGSFVIGNGYRGVGVDYELTIDSLRSMRHFLPAYRLNWRQMRLTIGPDFIHQLRAKLSREASVRALPEPAVNTRKVTHNLARLNELFPHLGGIALERGWAGRLDLTPDAIPILERPAQVPGLFIAAGFSGHGFALGPSLGKQFCEWITDGRPSLDLAPFRLSRFAEGIVHSAKKAL
jgi:glycine/D-amino acid oxidase-like deaminating enzyme